MKYKDSDISREARKFRYQEFLGLKSLPFLSEEQVKRFKKLSSLRVRDNKIGHAEFLKGRNII